MSTTVDHDGALHIEKLDDSFFKFAERDVDDGLLWGIGKISNESIVIPAVFSRLERIWDDLYYAQDGDEHSYLVFDGFENMIDLAEDFASHFNRLNFACNFDIIKITAKAFEDAYYYSNSPDLSGYKLIQLEAVVDNGTYFGCMQMRTSKECQSVLVVPPIYDDILLSRYCVSARRLVKSPLSFDGAQWEFYDFYRSRYKVHSTIKSERNRFTYSNQSFYSSLNPIDSIPRNVELLIYEDFSESVCPYRDFTIDECNGPILPIPYSDIGTFVLSQYGEFSLSVECVDKVKEVVSCDCLIIVKDGMYGVCGSRSLQPIYNYISRFDENHHCLFLCIEKYGKYGAFGIEERRMISPVYDKIESIPVYNGSYCDYQFIVRISNRYGVLDGNGDVIVPLDYNGIEVLRYSWACEIASGDHVLFKVKKDDHYGVFGLIDPIYDDVKLFVRSLSPYEDDIPYFGLKKSNGWYLTDKDGSLLFEDAYDSIDYSKTIDCFVYKKGGTSGTLSIPGQGRY